MATLSMYNCTYCDYSVQMSGQPDVLMSGSTIPCVCLDCKEITDRLVRVNFETEKEEIDSKCYECGSQSYEPWDYENKPCSLCEKGTMEVDPDDPIILAD
jgi:Zn finger protein HypA/HybF involved in hydrogenase expression